MMPQEAAPHSLERAGLIPPKSHGRVAQFAAHTSLKDFQGKLQGVGAKSLTRSERMINRIGRILAQKENVHVAVALDGKALVISSNKESTDDLLANVANKLKDILKNVDPLAGKTLPDNMPTKIRNEDIIKVGRLLNNEYTGEDGIELNDEIRAELELIKNAINQGVIDKDQYVAKAAGIYVITTKEDTDEFNMHGELKVTSAIKERRLAAKGEKFKDVFIGGAWLDCLPCNASHKIMNQSLTGKGWEFYSAGTHGGMFVGYRTQYETHRDGKVRAEFEALTGGKLDGERIRIPETGWKTKYSLNVKKIPENRQIAYESDSDDEGDYEILKYERLLTRLNQKGKGDKLKNDVITFKNIVESYQKEIKELKTSIKVIEKQNELDDNVLIGSESELKLLSSLTNSSEALEKKVVNASVIEKDKASLEQKLVRGPFTDRKVKWDEASARWVPDGKWELAGFSKAALDDASKSTKTRLELEASKSTRDEEEAIRRKKADETIKEERTKIALQSIEKSKSRLGENKRRLEKLIEELKVLKVKLKKEETSFFGAYKLNYKDLTRSKESIDSAMDKMDYFQFDEDL